jgi:hypothetical protein
VPDDGEKLLMPATQQDLPSPLQVSKPGRFIFHGQPESPTIAAHYPVKQHCNQGVGENGFQSAGHKEFHLKMEIKSPLLPLF